MKLPPFTLISQKNLSFPLIIPLKTKSIIGIKSQAIKPHWSNSCENKKETNFPVPIKQQNKQEQIHTPTLKKISKKETKNKDSQWEKYC